MMDFVEKYLVRLLLPSASSYSQFMVTVPSGGDLRVTSATVFSQCKQIKSNLSSKIPKQTLFVQYNPNLLRYISTYLHPQSHPRLLNAYIVSSSSGLFVTHFSRRVELCCNFNGYTCGYVSR
ncbi:hypothetical protein LWI29_006235 [Acer saccharum]|uniref:Uncharacterized protein n=1 Tax=Acer saccharum TaxID=4024 RepID=A0AA39SNZ9_ACESA|nr:hypothetical protein LWI29_006235 [Acer saccharum]